MHAELCKSTGTSGESMVINICSQRYSKLLGKFLAKMYSEVGRMFWKIPHVLPDRSHALQTSFWPKLKRTWTSYGYSCINHGDSPCMSISKDVTFN